MLYVQLFSKLESHNSPNTAVKCIFKYKYSTKVIFEEMDASLMRIAFLQVPSKVLFHEYLYQCSEVYNLLFLCFCGPVQEHINLWLHGVWRRDKVVCLWLRMD